MITRRMQIRRQLRSARVAALSQEERRREIREAEERCAQVLRTEPAESEVSPLASDEVDEPRPHESKPERAGDSEAE